MRLSSRAAAFVAVSHFKSVTETSNAVASLSAQYVIDTSKERIAQGRYLRGGAVPPPKASVWWRVFSRGDDLEFLHFTSLTRESFNLLVVKCTPLINSRPLTPGCGKPKAWHVRRRMFKARDVVAMTMRFLLATAEMKDLHVQFGAVLSVYSHCVRLGLRVIVQVLCSDTRSRVYWDRSEEELSKAAARTSSFLDIPGVVAMMDGDKLRSKQPGDYLHQNRDYNGWTKECNRNILIVWDPFGKIVDAVVNAPGNFHDSRLAVRGNVYKHIESLPQPYKVCCDDAFSTGGKLKDKLVKTKEQYREGQVRSTYDQSLTHLRQCSEWGNNVLTGVFRRLRGWLPVDNVHRAYIMWACVLLHNWRTETVGRNQIRT